VRLICCMGGFCEYLRTNTASGLKFFCGFQRIVESTSGRSCCAGRAMAMVDGFRIDIACETDLQLFD